MPSLFSLRSRLATELKDYLEEQFLRAAEMLYYFPAHLRASTKEGASGFDSVRQKVYVRTGRRDKPSTLPDGSTAYDPLRSRTEHGHRDAFRHQEKEELKPIPWDDTAGDKSEFKRAVILGDPGYGKTWLLRFEVRRLASKALEQLRDQKVPLDEIVIPLWMRLPEISAGDRPIEQVLIAKASSKRSEGFRQFVRTLLTTNRCVVLLDAWDEVPETGEQGDLRTLLGQRLKQFAEEFREPRILLTSRIVEFRNSPIPGEGTNLLELTAFDLEQVKSVIQVWFSHLPRQVIPILELVERNPQVRGLARIPLMLTLLCRTWSEEPLGFPTNDPSLLTVNPCELFEKCLRGLLGKWNRDDEKTFTKRSDAYVSAWQEMLQCVAFDLVNQNLQQFSESLFRTKIGSFTQHLQDEHELKGQTAADVIEELKNAGLLCTSILRADSSLIFLHRIFQEYLAACHLVEGIERSCGTFVPSYQATSLKTVPFPDTLVEFARSNSKQGWEVMLLAGRQLQRRSSAKVWELVGALCPRECGQTGSRSPAEDDRDLQMAWLAGQVLLETGLDGTTDLSNANCAIRTRVQKSLGWLLNEGRLTLRERAMAGVVLGKLGDVRPGVGLDAHGFSDFDWVPIETGPFPMGGRGGEKAGKQHVCKVTKKDFKMSRYPVTVAQFSAFVKAGGYEESGKKWWTKAGWEWRTKEGITRPEVQYRDVFQTSNHPQVGVSWYEAVAFCGWATEMARAKGLLKWFEKIILPSEAEWERVGGGLRGGIYAWGNDGTKLGERCNCGESGFGASCAVGMFPSGVSADDVRDMTGNVDVWTRSLMRDYPYTSSDGREDLDASGDRVVRGGYLFIYGDGHLRVTSRIDCFPVFRHNLIGFRCVVVGGASWLAGFLRVLRRLTLSP